MADTETQQKMPQDVFAEVSWKWLEKRIVLLIGGVSVKHSEKRPLPFFVSRDFAKVYKKVMMDVVFPEFLVLGSGFLRDAQNMEEDKWKKHFTDLYGDPKKRKFIWEAWKRAWKATMEEETIPPRPKPEKKSFSLKKLIKADKPKPGPKPMTEEQWKKKAANIKARNQKVAKNWGRLTAPSDAYAPPTDADNEMLRNMFGISAEGLNKDINAIRQIIEQGNNVGRTFDTYQNHRDVDMALVSVCFKMPNPLIEGDKLLKHLMMAHSRDDYPLTARYLPEFFKTR